MTDNALTVLLEAALAHFEEYHGRKYHDFVDRCLQDSGESYDSVSKDVFYSIALRYASFHAIDGRLARRISVVLENSLGKKDPSPFEFSVDSDFSTKLNRLLQ